MDTLDPVIALLPSGHLQSSIFVDGKGEQSGMMLSCNATSHRPSRFIMRADFGNLRASQIALNMLMLPFCAFRVVVSVQHPYSYPFRVGPLTISAAKEIVRLYSSLNLANCLYSGDRLTVLGERWPESLILLPSDLDDMKGVDLQVESAPLV